MPPLYARHPSARCTALVIVCTRSSAKGKGDDRASVLIRMLCGRCCLGRRLHCVRCRLDRLRNRRRLFPRELKSHASASHIETAQLSGSMVPP